MKDNIKTDTLVETELIIGVVELIAYFRTIFSEAEVKDFENSLNNNTNE